MNGMLKLAAMACAAMLATGTAYAQAPVPGGGIGTAIQNPSIANGGDTTGRDADRARQDAIDANRNGSRAAPKTARSVPARPDEVIAGADVRDPKGLLVGRIDSVSMGSAVIATEVGKAEVPLEAFGINNKGLLIPMSKADFDKAVAEANKGG